MTSSCTWGLYVYDGEGTSYGDLSGYEEVELVESYFFCSENCASQYVANDGAALGLSGYVYGDAVALAHDPPDYHGKCCLPSCPDNLAPDQCPPWPWPS